MLGRLKKSMTGMDGASVRFVAQIDGTKTRSGSATCRDRMLTWMVHCLSLKRLRNSFSASRSGGTNVPDGPAKMPMRPHWTPSARMTLPNARRPASVVRA